MLLIPIGIRAAENTSIGRLIVRTAPRLLPLLCISFLCVAPSIAGDRDNSRASDLWREPKVQLVQIGIRCYPNGTRVPIWAVMLGDTTGAERTARRYSGFGPYSLDASVWVRNADGPSWVRTTYNRPQTADEAAVWYENAEAFSDREEGGTELLSAPFRKLSGDLIRKVEFIVRYDDESVKAYLVPGTSKEDADWMVAVLDSLL